MSALLRACHPLPTVAVTAFATALGLAAGASAVTAVLLAAAVLTGQLSIGWLNDLVDADRDAAAGRSGKPVASGEVSRRTVASALAAVTVATVGLSLSMGLLPGLLHLVVVASGWAYDLRLKFTVLSPLPYLTAFGTLPAVAATAADAAVWPALMVSAGVLGVAAHFANTVPDVDADAATGVLGLPQRLGARRSQLVAAVGVVLACGVVLGGGGLSLLPLVLLACAAATGAVSPFAPSAWSFKLTLVAAALAVIGVVSAR